jgi:hypothetical protein
MKHVFIRCKWIITLGELFTVQLPMLITKHNVTLLCPGRSVQIWNEWWINEFKFTADELWRPQGSENETWDLGAGSVAAINVCEVPAVSLSTTEVVTARHRHDSLGYMKTQLAAKQKGVTSRVLFPIATNLTTAFRLHRFAWEADRRPAGQEMRSFLWNPKNSYWVHKNHHFTLSWINCIDFTS